MKITSVFVGLSLLFGCQGKADKKSSLEFKTELKKPLTEISGLIADGKKLWAITDKPKANAYLLNDKGDLEKEITIKNIDAVDVEAITSDNDFLYIGDVGDNEGGREERQIIKASKSTIEKSKAEEIEGEVIKFRFTNEEMIDKKKKNNYDCEAILSFGDSLYLFTKRREDQQTEVFSLPKTAGSYIARSRGTFDTKGLVTDAAVNKEKNEIALCGYHKGHKYPFILLLKNFSDTNFFSGTTELINLSNKAWDWQIESITYGEDDKMYFACEETNEVKSTLYAIKREKLSTLNKKSNDE